MMRALILAVALIAVALPAQAQRMVSAVSRTQVAITSSFGGETLTFFGNIEPEAGAADQPVVGPFHVIVAITGPLQNRVARKKSNVFGVWINTEQVVFEAFPSFLHILSDARLEDITDPVTLAGLGILPDQHARASARAGWWDATTFGAELVRLMTEQGHFGINSQGVVFRSNTLYSAQLNLRSDVPPGAYIAKSFLFKDGQLISQRSDGFSVRKTGFERFLGLAAVQQPLLYGIAAVILALFTGWLGGVVFRR
jgi:uncharacterized protein (TIGR02186 family)